MHNEIDKFELALDLINNTSVNIFLTGKAGTGKTTFLKSLREVCMKNYVVVAPTGIAAVNAHGVTMHSFFQLPFCPFLPDRFSINSNISKKKADIIKGIELLVIDEVSMLRADMLDAIDFRLREVRNNTAPFGGVQLLLIGDLFQLPPVAVGEEQNEILKHYKSLFFFESFALKKTRCITIELEKIFRQENMEFKEMLNSVRDGNVTQRLLEQLNKRYVPDFVPKKEEQYIRLVTHNLQANTINQAEMEQLTGEQFTYEASVEGTFPESSYPVTSSLSLKVGAHVMFCKNNSDGLYYNGTLGVVTSMTEESLKVKLQESGKEIEVKPEKWENIDYKLIPPTVDAESGLPIEGSKSIIDEQSIGSYTQYPLRLAWAITIHKSQGLTFDYAIIDAHRAFMAGQTYVALSRCRSLEGIVLAQPLGWGAIKCNALIRDFYKKGLEEFPSQEDVANLKREAYIQYVRRLLDMSRLDQLLTRLMRYMATHLANKYTVQSASIMQAHNAFSSTSGSQSEAILCPIENLARQKQGYDQNEQVQMLIVNACRFHLQSIKELHSSISSVEFNIGNEEHSQAVGKIMTELKEAIKLNIILFDYVIENGFCLIEIQRLLKKHVGANITQNVRVAENTDEQKPTMNQKVYDELVHWRLEKSRTAGVPAFTVLFNSSVEDIAMALPRTENELLKIKGVGSSKVAQYGQEILAIVKQQFEGDKVWKAWSEVMKKRAEEKQKADETAKAPNEKPKKATKDSHLVSLNMYKSGSSVEQIAEERGFVPTTIQGHLAKCVLLGLLPIEEIATETRLQPIRQYIADHPEATNKEIREAFDEQVEYFEIELARKYKAG